MNFLNKALGPVRGRVFTESRRSLAEIVMEDSSEIAQEGFFDTVRNMFRRGAPQSEKEFHEEGVDLPGLDKAIQLIRTAVRAKSEVRTDGTAIALGPYAKWMLLNGQFVGNEILASELKNIVDMLRNVQRYLIPASIASMKLVRESIIEPVMQGAKLNKFDDIKTLSVPSELDRLFAIKQPLYKGQTGMRTEALLGEWFLLKATHSAHIYISATTYWNLNVGTSWDKPKRPSAGEFDCLLPEQVKAIIEVLKDIHDEASQILTAPTHPEQERLQNAMTQFDDMFDTAEDISDARRSWGEAVYREGYHAIAQHSEAEYAAKYALHNVRVVLRLCEMSIRRMK